MDGMNLFERIVFDVFVGSAAVMFTIITIALCRIVYVALRKS